MIASKPVGSNDSFYTFNCLLKEQKDNGLIEVFKKIKQFYNILIEWYTNRELYHKIGYLIASKSFGRRTAQRQDLPYHPPTLGDLVNNALSRNRTTFVSEIDAKIRASIAIDIDIDSLTYGVHNNEIAKVLLLFNIQTYINAININELYPFQAHKDKPWSIEHIHARNSDNIDENRKAEWIRWLGAHTGVLQSIVIENPNSSVGAKADELKSSINRVNNVRTITWAIFEDVFNQVLQFFTDGEENNGEGMDELGNLALLRQSDNAFLSNSVFEVKRQAIMALDARMSFIPICTRRAFMKFYSTAAAEQNFYWSSEDRRDYLHSIKDTIQQYLPNNNQTSLAH